MCTQHTSNLQVARIFGVVPEQSKHIYSKYVHPFASSVFFRSFLKKKTITQHFHFTFSLNFSSTSVGHHDVHILRLFLHLKLSAMICHRTKLTRKHATLRPVTSYIKMYRQRSVVPINSEDRLVYSKYFNYNILHFL